MSAGVKLGTDPEPLRLAKLAKEAHSIRSGRSGSRDADDAVKLTENSIRFSYPAGEKKLSRRSGTRITSASYCNGLSITHSSL